MIRLGLMQSRCVIYDCLVITQDFKKKPEDI